MEDKVKVYHNPRCSKSRLALVFLEEKNIEFEVVEYLKNIPNKDEFQRILDQLGMKPEELLRKNEADYKEFVKGKNLTDNDLIDCMLKYPKLIERPIVIRNGRAVVARPTEKIEEILD